MWPHWLVKVLPPKPPYICVLIPFCMCPHAIYVSSYSYVWALLALPHLPEFCRCMCPHTAIYVSSYCYIRVLMLLHVSSYPIRMCPALLYMCPHTLVYVSSYCYIRVLILLHVSSSYSICMCPHTLSVWALILSSHALPFPRALSMWADLEQMISLLALLLQKYKYCTRCLFPELSQCGLIWRRCSVYLLYCYKSTNAARTAFSQSSLNVGWFGGDAQFTCFPGTKVQILTLRAAFLLSFSEISEQRGRKGRIN